MLRIDSLEVVVGCCGFFPIAGLLFCMTYSLVVDFVRINMTHCHRIINFLPSVSASISFSEETALVWFLFILIHTPFRFVLAKRLNTTYKLLFAQVYTPEHLASLKFTEFKQFSRIKQLVSWSFLLNKLEIAGLLILSTFTSTNNYEMHKLGFSLYLIASACFTLFVCIVESRLEYEKTHNCYQIKKKLALTYTASFILIVVFFIWHNKYCTSYVYSFFGLSEIVLVLSNVFFHCISYWTINEANGYQKLSSV